MTSSGVNLSHLPSEIPANNEVKFSPSTGDGSEDEDYSASLSAVLRHRRASVRRSRKGRARRPSSPFLADETRSRRRSSVFTTSSGDTAISIDDQPIVTQEQIFENIHLHKEVLGSVKQQPLGMRRKLKIVHQAKGYIKRHEGQLQERLAQSKSTRDIYARFNILLATKWQQLKREAANTSNLLIPWELRIKEIESHFGSVVASYFTFLRWLFWVNLVIGFVLLVFVIIPEYLTENPTQDGERKIIMEDERRNATNLLTLWEFEGALKYSAIFYGYYSNVERPEYRMPLAYFLTGLVVYVYSFVAILRKMAENSRMSKLSEKEDECIFSWKLFTGWDFMIGNAETAHNRIASVILGFKEALLEEAEKKKNLRNWRILSLRGVVNVCVLVLLAVSAYAVVTVVSRSDDGDSSKTRIWWRENETTIVVTVISITFPVFFELLGFLEHYHPRKQLRLQLASKIEGMSKELVSLQPDLNMSTTDFTFATHHDIKVSSAKSLPTSCIETIVPCLPCEMLTMPIQMSQHTFYQITEKQPTSIPISNTAESTGTLFTNGKFKKSNRRRNVIYESNPENIKEYTNNTDEAFLKEIIKIRNLSMSSANEEYVDVRTEANDSETYDINYD
ncbi:jg19754, partial [Pararge aegeria aegeria]